MSGLLLPFKGTMNFTRKQFCFKVTSSRGCSIQLTQLKHSLLYCCSNGALTGEVCGDHPWGKDAAQELHIERQIKGEARFIMLWAWLTPGCCGLFFTWYQLAIVLPHATALFLISLHISAAVSLENTEPVYVGGGGGHNGVTPTMHCVTGQGLHPGHGVQKCFLLDWAHNYQHGDGLRAMSSAWDFPLGREGCKPNGCKNVNAGHTKQLLSSQKTCVLGCYVNLERI